MESDPRFYGNLLISFIIPVKKDLRVVHCISELCMYTTSESLNVEIIVCGDLGDLDLGENIRVAKVFPAYKGRCIREGVLSSKGDLIIVCDADLPVLMDDINNLLENLLNSDVALGNRYLPASSFIILPPIHRRLISKVLRFFVNTIFNKAGFDTQCGIKAFRRAAALDLFSRQVSKSLVYDVQIILRALNQNMKITQVPIHWKSSPESTINLWISLPVAFVELLRLWKTQNFDDNSV
jgi:dolichyl-phosphate beta-glucosyltransferase